MPAFLLFIISKNKLKTIMKQILRLSLAVVALLCSNFAKATTTTVGATDNTTGWWTAFSAPYTIEPNKTLTLEFQNYGSKENFWNNWAVILTQDVDFGTADSEYFVLRTDNYGWHYGQNTRDDNTWYTSLTSNYNWDTFKTDMDGSTVVMTIKREGATVTVHADITTTANVKYFEEFVMDCGDGTQNVRAYLTVDNAHIIIDNDKTQITDTTPEVREPGQIGKTDKTTGFFGEYKGWPVNDDMTLTVQFKNYAGANNYNNFLVALANSDDRTAPIYKDYAIVRADNYAWKEFGVIDTDPQHDTSWFTSLSSNFNWDTFITEMDGADVTLTIQRKGGQVIVHADIITTSSIDRYLDFVMPIPADDLLYALLGVDGSYVVVDESKVATTATPKDIVGLETNTTPWWTQFSDYYKVEPGKTMTIEFDHYTGGKELYHTFAAVLASAERGAAGYEEYVVMRADGYAWQGELNSNDNQTWFTSFENNYPSEYSIDLFDGKHVVLKIIRDADEASKVTLRAEIGDDYYEEMVLTCGDGTQDIYAFLTVEKAYLKNFTSITDETPTAINATRTTTDVQTAVRYNLAGQRVSSDYKGVVIENGRKVIVK